MTNQTNPLENPIRHHNQYRGARLVDWTTPGLHVVRLRLVSDAGFPFWDVSYCHGTLAGEPVRVGLPFNQLPRRGFRAAIVTHAQRDGINASALGIFSNLSTLI